MNSFYVYAHFKATTGELFYIGKGSGRRAWTRTGRNRHWKEVCTMNLSDRKWMRRFMGIAAEVATWSKDTTKVGAVIVSSEGLVLSTGYNGIARGVLDDDERMARPAKYTWVCHGEEAAIANAARHGVRTSGSVLFCTHSPCGRCARQIINAGIRRVYVGDGQTSMPPDEFDAAATMFAEASVEVISMEMGE